MVAAIGGTGERDKTVDTEMVQQGFCAAKQVARKVDDGGYCSLVGQRRWLVFQQINAD